MQASKEWRVVTSFLDEWLADHPGEGQRTIDEPGYLVPRPLEFNPDLHKVLCSELKYLYTAVTRSRVNVWFYESDKECRAPMFDYFRRRSLVRVKKAEGAASTGKEGCKPTASLLLFSSDWACRNKHFEREFGTSMIHDILIQLQKFLEDL